jgi:hypothetical protein
MIVLLLQAGQVARAQQPTLNDVLYAPDDTAVNIYVGYAQKINRLQAYYNKELTPADRNILCQFLATYCTFTGNYEKAFYYDSVNYKPIGKREVGKQSLLPVDASTAILQAAAGHTILFFNESHVDVRTRAFLTTLLPRLKKLGYNKLALEALFMPVDKGYPVKETGFYTREPVFGQLIERRWRWGLR